MSTVTLSKPHWAITSAENPEGIASQAFTTALPDAQTVLTLFAIARVFPFYCLLWLLKFSTDSPLDTDLADADFTGGVYYRRPGIVRQGHPVPGAIGTHFPLGITGNQHGIDAGDGLGCSDKVDIARNFAVEEVAGIDHLGVDINREHAIGETPVRRGCAGAGQRAAQQFANECQTGTLVLAESADRARALGVVARSLGTIRTVEHRRIFTQRAVK